MGQREADSDGIEIREAESSDAEGIRSVALESMRASYADVLDEEVIETAVENWYADEAMDAELEEEGMLYLVAVAGDEVVGFSQNLLSESGSTGTVLWLHVDPDNRDENVGTTLLNQTLATFSDRGVERIAAEVLAENEAGCTFYEANGFEKASEREREIGGDTYVENLYVHEGRAKYETREYDGQTLYVNWAESNRGSKAPFYAAYSDEDGEELFGYFCSNCESFDTAMDSMERLECNDCGNTKKPVRWDASYL
ncbi:GNAT family N-acetyltransferase [Halorussus gelatinilyticus]|uniref:GNAT family N-acetyltransferase n=1 Tax=Halorussus gelatinilyticus TaxID=2937524 RepID=A0A8U0IFJ1_9EURY|nr:GNAT family N-acetyltransferase [Halorussus gelatinilyticus]UPV99445.1 GNAT family N-acetyltransferase [Halorussus gelatinilyticus]